jgi:hypothetical protein
MIKHLLKITGIFGFVLLSVGSGTTMSDVLRLCDQHQSYQVYATCIRRTYDAHGNKPNAGAVRAFYAGMEAIREANGKGAMSDIQAKSATYEVWSRTIDASNRANAPTVCRNYNGTLVCF